MGPFPVNVWETSNGGFPPKLSRAEIVDKLNTNKSR